MAIERSAFGELPDGTEVASLILHNGSGVVARIITWGGIVAELWCPDRHGEPGDVVLGYDHLEPYLVRHPYFGAICGRVANRIAHARFTLDGQTYQLAANDGGHALHGGLDAFDRKVWAAEGAETADGPALRLTHTSPDGDEGYPGTLDVEVVYTLAGTALRIDYRAVTDRPTPVNLTNHSYFNLAGAGTVRDHVLRLEADGYVPVDADFIPGGEIASLDGTLLDFRQPTPVGERIDRVNENPTGYDHCYVVRGTGLRPCAVLSEPGSGRVMRVETNEPGVQLYTGNFLDGSLTGKRGVRYVKHAGLCLETQHYPDSVNQPAFPTTVLRPGETFTSTTRFAFSAEG
ncbi:MAG: galactose mutarotase [Armatimonadetes bacterium]|nr:galactose mutarotase [Armatimonadota bacterium]